METRARDMDREVYQDPDSDRYLVASETVFDNAADDLETIAVLKQSMSLLPQNEVEDGRLFHISVVSWIVLCQETSE